MSTYNETASTDRSTLSPSRLTAYFEDRDDAGEAVKRLVAAGVDSTNVRLVAGDDTLSTTRADEGKGFWASLEDFFFPDDDRAVYSEGLRRGGFLVSVSGLTASLYDQALDVLDDEGSVDLDERVESWKAEGWAPETGAASGLETSGIDTKPSAAISATDDVIPVMEEELRVGKRDVNAGRVKVRAYTVSTPVNERVSLRDENVTIERRPVDRALDGTQAAFTDRTIEAEEHHEEAVVSKDARVVEEIAIRKTEEQREERYRTRSARPRSRSRTSATRAPSAHWVGRSFETGGGEWFRPRSPSDGRRRKREGIHDGLRAGNGSHLGRAYAGRYRDLPPHGHRATGTVRGASGRDRRGRSEMP